MVGLFSNKRDRLAKGECDVMGRWSRLATGSAIFAALSLVVAPAVGRVDPARLAAESGVSLSALGSIGSFTPVTSDSRLARAYADARSAGGQHNFRFTPTVGSMGANRSITIVVRAPSIGGAGGARSVATPSLGLGSVSFNLRTARGLDRFAAEATGSREADPMLPQGLELPKGFTIEKPKRLSTDVELEGVATGNGSPRTLVGSKGYAVDVTGSYSLTRNLDVTAGVRYNGRQQRLNPLTDQAQDDQAVYVGTTFKF